MTSSVGINFNLFTSDNSYSSSYWLMRTKVLAEMKCRVEGGTEN